MPRKSIGCAACGKSVPYGRLSCPACGALLASVAGDPGKTPKKVAAPKSDKTPTTEPSVTAMTDSPEGLAVPSPDERWDDEHDATEVAGEADGAGPLDAPERETADEPAEADRAAAAVVEGDGSAVSMWPPLADGSGPMLAPRPYSAGMGRGGEPADPDLPPPPGAYRPPSMVLAAAGGTMQPSWPGGRSIVGGSGQAQGGAAAAATDEAATDEDARFVEIADWFVIVGASLAVLGFLLPWSVSVIGSTGYGGYFDDWGLASPTHLLILIGLLGVLAVGILQTPVPAWLGTGVFGLLLGGLLIGLVWPYLFGRLGADIGAIIVGFGGLALVIGGVLACRATRHVEADPPV